MSEEVIRAVRMSLQVRKDASIDCYELPSGEKRVGMTGASIALGHAKDWLGRLPAKGQKLLKALQQEGYTGRQISVALKNDRGGTVAQTISVRDFIKVIGQDALLNKNKDAIILLLAFAEIGLEKAIDDLFSGHSTEYLLQKIVHYSEWTHEELQEVLAYNREEVRALYPWGAA